MEKIKQNAFVKKVGFNRIVLVCVLLLMYLAFGILTGGSFFGFSRIKNTLNYVYFLGFLSLGVTFVILDWTCYVLLFISFGIQFDNIWRSNGSKFDYEYFDWCGVWSV